MHKFINGLSILFFTLSVIIIFKTPDAGVQSTSYQPVPEVSETYTMQAGSENAPREQEAAKAKVEELQATIADLKNKLSENQSVQANTENPGPGRAEKLLAVLGRGTFRSGQVIVSENMIITVRDLIPQIKAAPGYRVTIEGHTDNTPIRSSAGEYGMDNMQLSFMRAKAVADILTDGGISPARISITGYGDTRPLESNDTPEGRMKNRRVEVKLIPEDREL